MFKIISMLKKVISSVLPLIPAVFLFSPYLVFAAGGGIGDFIVQLNQLINLVVPFIIGLAIFIIVYGIFGYVFSAADEEKRKEARDFIIWGVVGAFIMLSIWGLINILINTFNLNTTTGAIKTAFPDYTLQSGCTTASAPADLPCLIDRMNYVGMNYLMPFLISVAVFIVIIGIVNYVRLGDNEEKRKDARAFIIWGIVSIFLMLSVWGLVNILVNTFNFNSAAMPTIPQLPQL